MTKQELAKKIKEAVEYFEQDERGCYTLKLDDKLAICVGWLDGYDVTDTSINVKSYQVKNIYTDPASAKKGGAFNINNQIKTALTAQEILKTSSSGAISGYGSQFDNTIINDGLTITL